MTGIGRQTGLLLVILTLVLAMSTAVLAQVGPDIPREETLIVDILSGRVPNPTRFNPWAPGTTADAGIHQFMGESFWCVEYAQGEIINVLAKSPPIYNDDFTEMTVELREGIYWSDGVEFTAEDVIFTIETLKANPGMSYSIELGMYVDEIYKTDDYTVVFELAEPNSRFHTYFLDRWEPVGSCPNTSGRVEDPITFNNYPPVSLGQYALKQIDPGGYWFLWDAGKMGSDCRAVVRQASPRYVLFHYYGAPETKVIAQSRHELDMCDLTAESLQAAQATRISQLPHRLPLDRQHRSLYHRTYPEHPAGTL